MDSLICSYQMLMESAVSMWHSWHHLALQESSLSSSPSFMPCHACLSPPSLLFCLSFPLEPWSAWKMRVTLPRPLLWPAFYPISQSLGVVQQALSFSTFMRFKYVYLLTCHSTYNFFFASFPWWYLSAFYWFCASLSWWNVSGWWVEWSQERFYFGDNVLPCFESGIPLLKHRLHQLPDANNVRSSITCQMQIMRFHHISRILHSLAGLVVPSVEKAGWNYYLWK